MASYQSLYRRYRPQRFDEVLGQEHITKALRNAVRDDRVGHAYLFSGPRGTGKTSTARILAKVLNCAAPVDGEPCGECENCEAVAEGRVTDWLLEQDAASKSKVDDMRDLLERVPLGTSGNRKVIILDEVHMLSQGAENALLKTLEEPPAHVVFVLATTDPQKVRPTIRSRTQHFEFRLLPPDVLGDHVRHVITDAGLQLDDGAVDDAVDHVLRSGGGSARDTLSALDQVAALGEVIDEAEPVDAVVDGLVAGDAGRVLVAVADALASGRDPRTLGEGVIAALRDGFLSVMGAGDKHLAPSVRERAAAVGDALGPAGLTRALDVLGEALTELSRKPDPRVVVEVALVRLTEPAADRSLDAILARLERLERGLPAGGLGGGGPATGAGDAAMAASVPAATGSSVAAGADGPGAPSAGSSPAAEGAPLPADPASRRGTGGSAAAARDALSSARRSQGRRGPSPAAPPTATEPATGDAAAFAPPAETGSSGGPRPTLGSVSRGRAGAGGAGSSSATANAPSPAGAASGAEASSPPPDEAPGHSTPAESPSTGAAQTPVSAAAAPRSATPAAPPSATAPPSEGARGDLPSVPDIEKVWTTDVLAALPIKIRSKWRAGRWLEPASGELRFSVPNAWHKGACDEARRDVEQALAAHFGRPLTVGIVVDGDDPGGQTSSPASGDPAWAGGGASARPAAGGGAPPDDEVVDLAELRDAPDVATGGVDLVLREFPGGQVMEEDQ